MTMLPLVHYTQQAWLLKVNLCLVFAWLICAQLLVCAQDNKEELSRHIRLAEHFHTLGQYSQAKTELEIALKFEPKNTEILNSMGAVYLNLSESSASKEEQISNLAEARKYFTAALNIDPDFAAAWNGMAGVYYLNADNAKAISCYKKALALASKRSYEVYTNLANTLRDSGQADQAEENYRKAIDVNPLYAPAHNGYAELLYNKQRLSEALSEAVEAIRLKPDYATAYYHLGLIQSTAGNKSEALKAYLLSLRYEKNPRYAHDTQTLINQLGISTNSITQADLDQFRNGLCRSFPASPTIKEPVQPPEVPAPLQALQPRINNIHALMSSKDWQRATRELTALLKKHPDDAVILNELGLVYFNQKQYSNSETLFKRAAVVSDEQSSAILYNLAEVYLAKKDYVKAQENLEKAKKLASNDLGNRALINNALGIVLKQKGELANAQDAYQQAIADGGKQYPAFHYNLGVLLEKMNKNSDAAKEFNLYLQFDPRGLNAQNAQDRLKKVM